MGRFFIAMIGIAVSFLMMRYREQIGDSLGNADFMKYFGGPYNFVVFLAIIGFFWSVSYLTGTTQILFFPIYMVMGGAFQN